jgi:hypothetical protein
MGWLVLGILIVLAVSIVTLRLIEFRVARLTAMALLEGAIRTTWQTDARLTGLPIEATATSPLLRRTAPLRIEVSGQLPSRELRDAALQLAGIEAAIADRRFVLVDRVSIGPSLPVDAR